MFKTQIFYIQIKENEFLIRSVVDARSISVKAEEPFSTKRLLIADFGVAEKLLKSTLQKFQKIVLIKPIMIMHPLEKIDAELSEVEEKVFQELALSAGAREVKLWIGEELNDEELLGV